MKNRKSEFEIYNNVYNDDNEYATPHREKIEYISNWAGSGNKILDIGCGRGEYLREVLKNNEAFGIELSSVCCEKYLTDVPHECIDAASFCKKTPENLFNKVYCVDVLEHLRPNELEETLELISKLSNDFLFLVASGSDIKFGVELHMSNHNFEEWSAKLSKYFSINKSIKGFKWPYIHIFEVTKNER